jgi:hypothetical protein
MVDTAIETDVILFCLPAHTTHRLQPCDVGVFGPLKKHWNTACSAYFELTRSPLPLSHVVMAYMAARKEAFTEETILQAWRKSGFEIKEDRSIATNRNIFTDEDFQPSTLSSTKVSFPDSYPQEYPPGWATPPDVVIPPQLALEFRLNTAVPESNDWKSDDESDEVRDAQEFHVQTSNKLK